VPKASRIGDRDNPGFNTSAALSGLGITEPSILSWYGVLSRRSAREIDGLEDVISFLYMSPYELNSNW
jgi:hypothetical protein